VIEALGDYKAQYALEALTAVARLDGPLQDDAGRSPLGKIGDKRRGWRRLPAFSARRRRPCTAGDCHRHLSARRQLRVSSELSDRHV